jgi:RNA polymerase sigma-70 factor, ECF subfamily
VTAPMFVEEAYGSYRDQLLSFLVSLTRNRDTAEDLLQETYVRLAREHRAGRAPENVRAWLYRVARNTVISGGRRRQVAERWLARQPGHGVGASAEEHYLLRAAGAEVRAALLELDSSDQTALLMAAEGYTGAEIAAATGRSCAAVRTRMCRARGRLRDRLQARAVN